jgi:hypothetical protein
MVGFLAFWRAAQPGPGWHCVAPVDDGGQNRRRQSRAYATLVKLDAIDVVGGDGASIGALRTRGGISPAGLSARYR